MTAALTADCLTKEEDLYFIPLTNTLVEHSIKFLLNLSALQLTDQLDILIAKSVVKYHIKGMLLQVIVITVLLSLM